MTQAHNNENGSLQRWRAHNPCYWCRQTNCMVREHGFKGPWPEHLSRRYATHQSLWTAIRGLAQSGKPLPAIAKAMDVDISSWPALDKDDFLIRVLAESSGLPEWDDAMMDGEFQTRSLMITANPSLDPREPQKKGKHKKKAKKSPPGATCTHMFTYQWFSNGRGCTDRQREFSGQMPRFPVH